MCVCVLKVVRKKADRKSIRDLRAKVVIMVRQLYEDGAMVCGIDVGKLIDESYADIDEYVKHVQTNQWAPLVELHCAAMLTKTYFVVMSKHGSEKIGESLTRSVISLKNNHYVLMKNNTEHGKKYEKHYTWDTRGGMMTAWTWQNDSDDDVPARAWSSMIPSLEAQRGEFVHVQMGAEVMLQALAFHIPPEAKISALKVRLVDILGISRSRLAIFKRNEHRDELPEWAYIPESVIADDLLASPIGSYVYITIFLTPVDQKIILPVAHGVTEDEIRLSISRITGYPLSDMMLENVDGTIWMHTADTAPTSRVILTLRTLRGGMDPRWEQRSRSRSRGRTHEGNTVSTTDPFENVVYYHDQYSSSSSPEASAQY